MISFKNNSELERGEAEKLRVLYKEGFPHDTDAYVDYFFAEKIFTVCFNEEITSALYLIPKNISAFGKSAMVDYVAAFSASKSVRGTGTATSVMHAAIEYEAKRGVPYIFLSPFNYEYYLRYGFVNADKRLVSAVKREITRVKCDKPSEFADIMSFVRGKVSARYSISQTAAAGELLNKVEEELSSPAEAYALYSNGCLYGYEFEAGGKVYDRLTVDARRTRKPWVQARIACPEAALNLAAARPEARRLTLKVTDSVTGGCNLSITADNGKVNAVKTDSPAECAVTVEELTAYLLSGQLTANPEVNEFFLHGKTVMYDKY